MSPKQGVFHNLLYQSLLLIKYRCRPLFANDYFDPFIQKYLKRAKQQKYLTYLIFETNKILDNDTKGMLDGEFVISRDLYNNILEYGVIAECGCQNNDGNWTVGGSLKEKKSQ